MFQDLNSSDDLPCLLKGADNVVYMSEGHLVFKLVSDQSLIPLQTIQKGFILELTFMLMVIIWMIKMMMRF